MPSATNKVTVNGSTTKPSREVKVGDVIAVRKMQVTYSYRVLDLVSSRPAGQECPPVLPQHHPAGGAGQAQHPARNDLRLPRPRYGAPDQKGAPRTGRADGRNLLRREKSRPACPGVSPSKLLTFASSSVAAALGALLLGLRIPAGRRSAPCARQGAIWRCPVSSGLRQVRRHVPASGRRG